MSATPTVPTVQEREERLRDQLLSIKERQVAAALRRLDDAEQREKKLRESWDWDGFRSLDLVIDRVRSANASIPGHAPLSTVNDRRYGHNWPFWRTWQEHAGLRATARMLEGLSSLVPGALRGLSAYVIGTGYTYRSASKNEAPETLVAAVQDVIDEFCTLNTWSSMEEESFYRSRRDGEIFHHHIEENGRLLVDWIEPEEVYPPAGDSQDWSYGIRTQGRATNRPLAYCLIDSPLTLDTRVYSADEVLHYKINVDARIKRGKSDLCYDTADIFRTAGRLAEHIGTGAAIQASIALIREHEGVSSSQVRNFSADNAAAQTRDSLGNTQDVQLWEAGTELDINAGQKYVVPPFATNVQGFLGVVKGILQCVAVRWNAPEWLVSADASNNNYASSITAESPFVKRCYAEQKNYKAFFLRSIWAAVRVAAEAGRIRAAGKVYSWDEVRYLCDIQAEAPNIEVRDDAKTAQTDKTYIEAGVKSVQTTQQELGLDSAQELRNIRQWRKEGGQAATATAASGEQQTGQQGTADGDPTAGLRGSVGGSQALLTLQQSYYQKQVPRDACIANARIVFGFSQQDAEALFPEMPPDAPADPDQSPDGQPPVDSEEDNPLASIFGGKESRQRRRKRKLRESEWEESKHQRAADGRFGSGGGHSKDAGSGRDKKTDEKTTPDRSGSKSPGASPQEVAQAQEVAKTAADPGKRAAWWKRSVATLAAVGEKAGAGLRTVGKALYDRSPHHLQMLFDAVGQMANGIHHALEKIKTGIQRVATQAARERGLPETHVERVAKGTRFVDSFLAWTTNIPIAHEALHHAAHHLGDALTFGYAKIGYFIPVGSLAYLVTSTVKNPLATLRAAIKVIGGWDEEAKKGGHESEGQAELPLCGKELMGELLQRLHDAGDAHDWYYALWGAALSKTHDSRAALAIADSAFASVPSGDDLAAGVTPEEAATIWDGWTPPGAYEGKGGRESAGWDESKHQRAEDGRFGSGGGGGGGSDEPQHEPGTPEHYRQTSAKIKAQHAFGKAELQAEHRQKRAEIHAKHVPAKAEIEGSLKAALGAEKDKGRAKLKKLAAKQKKLRARQAALKAQLAASEQATEAARQSVSEVQAAGGYLGETLSNELADPASYTAAELVDACQETLANHPWDPAQDPDWNQTDYDETTDSEVPIHTPEETRAEQVRRAEAKAQLRELGMALLAHKRAEGRGHGLGDQIEDLDSKIEDLDDQRQEHVDRVNERIAGHREKHQVRYEAVKEKVLGEKGDLKDAYRDRYEDHKAASRAQLDNAKDAHRTAREKKK